MTNKNRFLVIGYSPGKHWELTKRYLCRLNISYNVVGGRKIEDLPYNVYDGLIIVPESKNFTGLNVCTELDRGEYYIKTDESTNNIAMDFVRKRGRNKMYIVTSLSEGMHVREFDQMCKERRDLSATSFRVRASCGEVECVNMDGIGNPSGAEYLGLGYYEFIELLNFEEFDMCSDDPSWFIGNDDVLGDAVPEKFKAKRPESGVITGHHHHVGRLIRKPIDVGKPMFDHKKLQDQYDNILTLHKPPIPLWLALNLINQ